MQKNFSVDDLKVIIIAGGKGTRLKPFIKKLPKPLIKLEKKAVIHHTISFFSKYNINNFILSLYYNKNVFIKYINKHVFNNIRIELSMDEEEESLGTAGSIAKLKRRVGDAFIVVYGDMIWDFDFKKMLEFHLKKKSLITVGLQKKIIGKTKSRVLLGEDCKILEFIEDPGIMELTQHKWSNGCIYMCDKQIFKYIPNRYYDFGKDLFPMLIKKNEKILGFPLDGAVYDIGTVSVLRNVREKLKSIK